MGRGRVLWLRMGVWQLSSLVPMVVRQPMPLVGGEGSSGRRDEKGAQLSLQPNLDKDKKCRTTWWTSMTVNISLPASPLGPCSLNLGEA
jgi:hypothetical protein